MMEDLIWFAASLAIGAAGVRAVRAYAIKRNWLDIPNARSFHQRPVPRIGGIGMLLPVLAGIPVILLLPAGGLGAGLLLLGPALGVALLSLCDDRFELPRLVRFGGHAAAALILLYFLRGVWPQAIWPVLGVSLPLPVAAVLLFLWVTGLTNSYNFMDGIDGIAASQALVALAGWVSVFHAECLDPLAQGQTLLLLCLAGGVAGFLIFNRAPASIFMGDVGSTFLGFYLAGLPLVVTAHGIPFDRALEAGVLFTWPFILDTGVTFTRRLIRREPVFEAHRSHLYQVMAATYAVRRTGHHVTSLLFGLLALMGVALYWTPGPLWAKLAVLAGVWVALTAWVYGIRRKNIPLSATSHSTVYSPSPDDPVGSPLRSSFMPFDIFLSPPEITDAEQRLVLEALASGFIAPVGPQVNAFEQGLSRYLGLDELLALSSGTAAIHLGLRALGVGPGDCVLTPDLTFIASVNPIRYLGAEPVLIDVSETSWSMNPDLAREAIRTLKREGRTIRAMVIVHAFGIPADMDALLRLAREEGIAVLEDCAGAFGATIGGRQVGSFGDAAAYSFNGNKVLTTSGGGAVHVRDPEMRKAARSWANQGKRHGVVGYHHEALGYNYKLSNICAAIGIAQLETLPGRLARKQAVFRAYQERLGRLSCVSFMPEPAYGHNNYWLTAVGLETAGQVEDIITGLREQLIEAAPMWKPMHQQEFNRDLRIFGGQASERIHRRFVSLPSGSALKEADLERVCEALRSQLQVAT